MNIISDFNDIARRMNRKPEKVAVIDNSAAAAVKTLQSLGYTHTDGAEMWKPPTATGNANYNNALFGALKAKSGVSSADVVKSWKEQQMEQYLGGKCLGEGWPMQDIFGNLSR